MGIGSALVALFLLIAMSVVILWLVLASSPTNHAAGPKQCIRKRLIDISGRRPLIKGMSSKKPAVMAANTCGIACLTVTSKPWMDLAMKKMASVYRALRASEDWRDI